MASHGCTCQKTNDRSIRGALRESLVQTARSLDSEKNEDEGQHIAHPRLCNRSYARSAEAGRQNIPHHAVEKSHGPINDETKGWPAHAPAATLP